MGTRLRLAPGAKLTARTRAKGLLGKLAHDLELACEGLEGAIELTGDGFEGTLSFAAPPRVDGVLKGDRVDRGVLSDGDRREIEDRMRRDAFGAGRVEIAVKGASRSRGTATVRLRGPSETVDLDVRATPKGSGFAVDARAKVSLSRLGVPEIKGPLGAFKVADEVEISLVGDLVD